MLPVLTGLGRPLSALGFPQANLIYRAFRFCTSLSSEPFDSTARQCLCKASEMASSKSMSDTHFMFSILTLNLGYHPGPRVTKIFRISNLRQRLSQ
jgi:hypothetical protein